MFISRTVVCVRSVLLPLCSAHYYSDQPSSAAMVLRIVASFCSSLRSSPLPAPTALAAVRPAAAKPSLLRSCESVRPLTWLGVGAGVGVGLGLGLGLGLSIYLGLGPGLYIFSRARARARARARTRARAKLGQGLGQGLGLGQGQALAVPPLPPPPPGLPAGVAALAALASALRANGWCCRDRPVPGCLSLCVTACLGQGQG